MSFSAQYKAFRDVDAIEELINGLTAAQITQLKIGKTGNINYIQPRARAAFTDRDRTAVSEVGRIFQHELNLPHGLKPIMIYILEESATKQLFLLKVAKNLPTYHGMLSDGTFPEKGSPDWLWAEQFKAEPEKSWRDIKEKVDGSDNSIQEYYKQHRPQDYHRSGRIIDYLPYKRPVGQAAIEFKDKPLTGSPDGCEATAGPSNAPASSSSVQAVTSGTSTTIPSTEPSGIIKPATKAAKKTTVSDSRKLVAKSVSSRTTRGTSKISVEDAEPAPIPKTTKKVIEKRSGAKPAKKAPSPAADTGRSGSQAKPTSKAKAESFDPVPVAAVPDLPASHRSSFRYTRSCQTEVSAARGTLVPQPSTKRKRKDDEEAAESIRAVKRRCEDFLGTWYGAGDDEGLDRELTGVAVCKWEKELIEVKGHQPYEKALGMGGLQPGFVLMKESVQDLITYGTDNLQDLFGDAGLDATKCLSTTSIKHFDRQILRPPLMGVKHRSIRGSVLEKREKDARAQAKKEEKEEKEERARTKSTDFPSAADEPLP